MFSMIHRMLRERPSRPRLQPRRTRRLEVESLEDRTLLTAGALDATFGGDGVVTTDLGGSEAVIGSSAIAVQPDGQVIVVATSGQIGNSDFAVLRYLEDGSLDPTFGLNENGATLTDIGGDDFATDVAIQPDGKIVVSGRTEVVGNTHIRNSVLVRYNNDGTLDATFGSGGIVVADFLPGGLDQIQDLDIQSDGKIVTAVLAGPFGQPSNFLVARFNSNGSVDGSFGAAGQTSIDFGSSIELITRLSVQSDDGIVVGGRIPVAGGNDFAMARLDSTGDLDVSFGTGGKVVLSQSGLDSLNAMEIDSHGRIVAGGSDTTGTQASLVRLTSNGAVDASFGSGGIVTPSLGSSRINSLAIQSDDAIVVALVFDAPSTIDRDFTIARFTVNGVLDSQFGTGGISVTGAGNGMHDSAVAVAIRSDGSIVAAGYTGASVGLHDIMVARFVGDNAEPVANDDVYEVNEDGTLVVDAASGVLVNDTDPDLDVLSVSQVISGPSNGTLTLSPDGSFTYVPFADFNGTDNFTYEVSDGNGGLATAIVTINVLSTQQQIDNAFSDVNALVAAGILNNGQGNSLTSKLGNVTKKFHQGNTNAGINQLEAFINQIEAFINAGILDDDDAEDLIDRIANAILSAGSNVG